MRFKKLILPVLGLFVLSIVSHAGSITKDDGIPETIKIIPSGQEHQCDLRDAPADYHFDSFDKVNFPKGHYIGDYAHSTPEYYELAEKALTEKNKTERDKATVLVALCARKCKICSGYRIKDHYYNLLQLAGYYGNTVLADYLVNKAKWDVNDGAIKTGDTALILASGSKIPANKDEKEKIVKKLVEGLGADVNIRNYKSKTPAIIAKEAYDRAVEKGNIELKNIFSSIYKYLEPKTSKDPKVIGEMIHDAANRAVNYALTDKESIAKTIAKIADTSIFRDGMKWLDLNGYNFDNLI
jgi:hypothetical protein